MAKRGGGREFSMYEAERAGEGGGGGCMEDKRKRGAV